MSLQELKEIREKEGTSVNEKTYSTLAALVKGFILLKEEETEEGGKPRACAC